MYFVFLIYNTTQILCTDLPLVEKKNLPNIFTYHHNMTHYKHFPEIHVKLGILVFSDILKELLICSCQKAMCWSIYIGSTFPIGRVNSLQTEWNQPWLTKYNSSTTWVQHLLVIILWEITLAHFSCLLRSASQYEHISLNIHTSAGHFTGQSGKLLIRPWKSWDIHWKENRIVLRSVSWP